MTQANDKHGLANKKLEYTYTTGDKVILNIGIETLRFEWIGGHLDGTRIGGLEYTCKGTREGQFLLKWHNLNAKSYVTLLIDIKEKKVYGSALVEYLSDKPFEIFDEAMITQVSKLD
ncbi:MAG: hypothetical protein P8P98_03340 [Emcibacteraceae bacterium]|nr:hypothetical protein [Emcibacteraceae bacterium]